MRNGGAGAGPVGASGLTAENVKWTCGRLSTARARPLPPALPSRALSGCRGRCPGPVSQPASQSASQARSACPGPGGPVSPVWGWGGGALLARGGEGRAGGFGELGLQAGTGGQAVGFVPQCEAASAWAAQGQRGLVLRWCGWFLTLQA